MLKFVCRRTKNKNVKVANYRKNNFISNCEKYINNKFSTK